MYKKLFLIAIVALALTTYVLPVDDWYSQVTAQSNDKAEDGDGEQSEDTSESESETEEEEEEDEQSEDVAQEEEQTSKDPEQDEEVEPEANDNDNDNAGADQDKLKDNDPDANNGNGNDEVDDEVDDPDGNPNNREGTPGTERCLERSNGNCAHSPVHDGDYGDTSEDDGDSIEQTQVNKQDCEGDSCSNENSQDQDATISN